MAPNSNPKPTIKTNSNERCLGELPEDGKCYMCGSTEFWRRKDGGYLCKWCHPPMDIAVESYWISKEPQPFDVDSYFKKLLGE
jgi:hypothetical protein